MAENEELDVHDREVSLSDVMQAVKTQGEFNASLRKDISDLRQEVHGATVSVASQVKKLKTESQYNWKYEGNKVQFLLNTEFLEDLTQSIWAIDNSKVDYARDTIKEVIDKIKRRNKLIKIADSSEGGWETVRQYETNPVASDSDDESKINKAENKALRKRNSKGKKAAAKPNFNYESSAPSQFNATFPAKNQPFRDPQSWYNGQALYHGQASQASTSGNHRGNQQRQGACYGCGSFQHWRNQCPFNPRPGTMSKPK
ncbi:unnamed protein product [Mytilus edulis]|uniref:CCHC-type domain-containing protein n=1 Tax=Mytilus edulis TaxID=6550 RepID=A0A8S3QT80_MYTED|nr:unnamed protein product [Mytilus edulis]